MDEWEGRLRIALFTNVYLPTTNGVVVSIETFRKAFTKLGHHAYVFGPHSGDIEDRAPYIFRYPALELPLQKYPLAFPVSPYIDHLLENLKPQILHANHPALLGRVAMRKSHELDLPLVFTYHTRYADYAHYADPLPQDMVKEFIQRWLGGFMSECHQVVVPSQSIKEMLEQTYGISEGIEVVPTGVDTRRFAGFDRRACRQELGWDDDHKYLVSIGRLAKEKSFDLLLRAFAQVKDPSARLVIIGSGDEKEALQKLCHDLGLSQRVTFTGLVPFPRIPVYLTAADLFTFASVTETQGLVTMEAMACGLPVAAVNASGTREAVSPECGVLTEPSPEALARGIRDMLARDDLPELSAHAQKAARAFDIVEQGMSMVSVYEKAMEAHRMGRRVHRQSTESANRLEEFFGRFFKD